MSDRRPFLDAIRQAPGDDAPRLVYADWLDENGEHERAGLTRFQVAGGKANPTPARARRMLPDEFASDPAFGEYAAVRERMRLGFFDLCCAETSVEFAAAERFRETEVFAAWHNLALERLEAGPVPQIVAECDRLELRAGAGGFGPLGRWAPHLRARSLTLQTAFGCGEEFAADGPFPRVEILQLIGRRGDPAHEAALVAACPALRRLDVEPGLWAGGPAAARKAGLRLDGIRDLGVGLSGLNDPDVLGLMGVGPLDQLRIDGPGVPGDLLKGLVAPLELRGLELTASANLLEMAAVVPNLLSLTAVAGPGAADGALRREVWPRLERLTLSAHGVRPGPGTTALEELGAGDLVPGLRSLTVIEGNFVPPEPSADAAGLLRRLVAAGPLRLERLNLGGMALSSASLAALAGLDAPLETLTVLCPKLTAKAVNELARAPWVRGVRAVNLGPLSAPARRAAVRAFGPRCDAYWQGDDPP